MNEESVIDPMNEAFINEHSVMTSSKTALQVVQAKLGALQVNQFNLVEMMQRDE